MSTIRYINGVPNTPQALGPYSQATIIDNLVYLSGQIPLDPISNKLVTGGIESQADQVMRNILTVLNFLQLDFSYVMKTTIFMINLRDFGLVNDVYAKWMGPSRPARSTIQVAGLPLGSLIEIEMIATLELSDAPTLAEGSVADLKNAEINFVDCSKAN